MSPSRSSKLLGVPGFPDFSDFTYANCLNYRIWKKKKKLLLIIGLISGKKKNKLLSEGNEDLI